MNTKQLVTIISVVIAIGLIAHALIGRGSVQEYSAPEPVIEMVVPVDNVSEAQKQLNEAKRLLDAEEQSILLEIAEKENRLEGIREVRLSFSQAPGQVR